LEFTLKSGDIILATINSPVMTWTANGSLSCSTSLMISDAVIASGNQLTIELTKISLGYFRNYSLFNLKANLLKN
jgi:hypothetical protein